MSDEDVKERLEVFARAIDARDTARVRSALAPLAEPSVGEDRVSLGAPGPDLRGARVRRPSRVKPRLSCHLPLAV